MWPWCFEILGHEPVCHQCKPFVEYVHDAQFHRWDPSNFILNSACNDLVGAAWVTTKVCSVYRKDLNSYYIIIKTCIKYVGQFVFWYFKKRWIIIETIWIILHSPSTQEQTAIHPASFWKSVNTALSVQNKCLGI